MILWGEIRQDIDQRYIRTAINCYVQGDKYCEFGWND